MIPHLSLPLRVDATGRMVTVEQDSPEELAQNVAVILATAEGSRVEAPDFGTPRLEFSSSIPVSDIIAAVTEWEPRVDLDIEAVRGLGDAQSITQIRALVTPHV